MHILPDYSVTTIQESSIVEEIVHKMAENDHNSYFQIVCSELTALKIPLFKSSIIKLIKSLLNFRL